MRNDDIQSIIKGSAGYSTQLGDCICCDSKSALKLLNDNTIDLVMTSPPFALQRKKAYGNESQDEYVDWLCEFGKLVYSKLKETGSVRKSGE